MSLAMTDIRIDFNVDDTPESLAAMLDRLGLSWSESAPIRVDLADYEYLGPAAVVVLCCLLASRSIAGAQTDLVPPKLPKLLAYCEFSGLMNRFLGDPTPDASHPKNETLAVTEFSAFDMRLLGAVTGLVRRHIDIGAGAEEALKTSLSEMMYNVVDHADSPVGGLLSARAFNDVREVRVVIADIGVGVLATLRRTMPNLGSHRDALQEAMKGNRSARSTSRNLGQGLTNIDSIVRRNGGQLMLASYDSVYIRRGETVRIKHLRHPFPGTLACIRFRVDNALYDEDIEDNDVW